ncbi:glucuronate isomerase [Providencia vermicola]|uniref:Uronate isomerase n=1 Tax=Providencia vermicola TaxID=333965 RepID=A0AAX3RQV5_9GAMM|nr:MULTISPECIES: glucuronate isomerase [Providencia]ELX8378175.1 glucuronate isomerase [Providencia stuartii]EMD5258991.1 glucuronate isomerase [Providencia stuartii]USB36149.1 glucuronate isomerase [Providencia vermicola]WFC05019.1 glucuronate isomerase [Providencia vermicola]
MKSFLCENFLLNNKVAQNLYHDYAAKMPIYDYHCHLNPQEIAENRQFDNLGQIWLEGDHYKWRAMRSAGIPERFITGRESSDYEKYLAWAKTVPMTLGNPLYHWTHLELRRPFGITGKLLSPTTADDIWHEANERLSQPAFSTLGIMQQMQVHMVGTTDDPIDSLIYHRQIAQDKTINIEVRPSWRPDRVFKIEQVGFADYIEQLGESANIAISRFSDLLFALERRLEYFAFHGCIASDHGIDIVRYAPIPDETVLDRILQTRLQGKILDEIAIAQFSTAILVWLGKQYAKYGWVMQLHIGAMRNNNRRQFMLLGSDSGFDAIGDLPIAYPLSRLLDEMDKTNELPRTILYCANPRDNDVLAALIGNFQDGEVAGKIQFGSAWWFNDQKEGMQRQLEQLSQLGLLSLFIGMLTDSRSFLSYTRHEYFRRILCNMLGTLVMNGEMPAEEKMIGQLVENICFYNAKRYFSAITPLSQ